MKHLTKHTDLASFELVKGSLELPHVALIESTGDVVYLRVDNSLVKVLYTTNEGYLEEGIDYDHWYQYDGTITIEGETLHKWRLVSDTNWYPSIVDKWMITDTDDFSEASIENPMNHVGLMIGDSYDSEYLADDLIVLQSTKEKIIVGSLDHHNTSTLNANGHDYVDLGLASGALWATMNVGATSETEYGDYFAWGETTTKSTYSWSTYKYGTNYNQLTKYNTKSDYGTVDNKTTLEASDDAASVNWGGDWKIPSYKLLNELIGYTNNEWTTIGGINGRKFTSKTDSSKSIFIPASGNRDGSSLFGVGDNFELWSGSLYGGNPSDGIYLDSDSGGSSLSGSGRFCGFAVRPVLY